MEVAYLTTTAASVGLVAMVAFRRLVENLRRRQSLYRPPCKILTDRVGKREVHRAWTQWRIQGGAGVGHSSPTCLACRSSKILVTVLKKLVGLNTVNPNHPGRYFNLLAYIS